MQNSKGYIINRSNFTIKKRNKKFSNGEVYERDFMTTTNLGGWDGITIPYGESNFKMRPAKESFGYARKHKYGDWLTNNGNTIWTEALNSIPENVSTEGRVEIKPNYSSLLDFAYFGSCSDLVKFSITDIIKNFPGELYITDEEVFYEDVNGNIQKFENGPLIENPLKIDISSSKMPANNAYSELRYFCTSANRYELLSPSGDIVGCINSWIVEPEEGTCFNNGDLLATITLKANKYDAENVNHETTIVIEEYLRNSETVLILKQEDSTNLSATTYDSFTGFRIRPASEYIDYYFNNIDDFEKLLLNRRSNPIFSATIDNPNDTEYGILFNKKTFTWPTFHGWNLDVETEDYSSYFNSLVSVADFFDENFSNNMWRMLTHESIKNMDTSLYADIDEEEFEEGKSIIESVIKIYGRQFDELKRLARSIKNQNVVTYDGNGNIPDYFLSDVLELSGWDISSVISPLSKKEETGVLFPGESIGYSTNEMSTSFMRNLKVNSKSILAKKGTRAGIEAILGLFGLVSGDFARSKGENEGDYEISEYVVIAKNNAQDVVPIDEELPAEKYNELKLSNETDMEGSLGTEGLPVKIVEFIDSAGTEMKYMIPWFGKNEPLDGNVYFQMKGGWGKVNSKEINESIAKRIKKIVSDGHFTIFSETLKYLKIVKDIESLLGVYEESVINGNIFYVEDITEYIENYNGSDSGSSHYFILNDKENCHEISNDGWENISNYDIENGIGNGTKVLYLESIIDQYKGNNPHVGHGNYDGGKEFFEYLKQIFKYSIDNDNFSDEAYDCNGDLLSGITSAGFENVFSGDTVNYIEDNVKCWYFTDKYNLKRANELVESGVCNYEISTSEEIPVVPIGSGATDYTLFTSDVKAFNLETQEDNDIDIAAANSIVNSKRLKISFNIDNEHVEEFRKYFYTCIYPYLVQMVPSTALLEIEIENDNVEYTCIDMPSIAAMTDAGCECEGCCEEGDCEGE